MTKHSCGYDPEREVRVSLDDPDFELHLFFALLRYQLRLQPHSEARAQEEAHPQEAPVQSPTSSDAGYDPLKREVWISFDDPDCEAKIRKAAWLQLAQGDDTRVEC